MIFPENSNQALIGSQLYRNRKQNRQSQPPGVKVSAAESPQEPAITVELPPQGKFLARYAQRQAKGLSPLTGKEAFTTWLALAFKDGEKIWLKLGHNKFFTGTVDVSGDFAVWRTKGTDTKRRKGALIQNAYAVLSNSCQELDGGAFYIPGKPTDYPLKQYCLESDDIGAEMDDGTAQEQWGRIERFVDLSSLLPGYIIGSGGKSAHPHWKLLTTVNIALRTFYARMVAISLLGDPAVANPHQPMRVPGFFRKEKGKEQALEYHSEARYTPEEFEAGLQQCFTALNFTWRSASEFSEERWLEIRRVLANKILTKSEKETKISYILALSESNLPGNSRRRELEQKRSERLNEYQRTQRTITNNTCSSLVDAVNQASQKLGSDAFDWTGHNWQWRGSKARGCCPWHESTTGTAGWIAPLQNGNGWGYACPTCTDNKQLNAFGYWWHLKHGINASYPKGAEWAAAAKEFCQQASVDVPEFKSSYQYEDKEDEVAQAIAKEQEQFEEYVDHHIAQISHDAKVQWLANYPKRVARTQEQLNSFDAWVTDKRNERYLNLCIEELKSKPGIHLIKSGMNTGKSTVAKLIVAAFSEGNVASYRNSLLEQFCESLGGLVNFIWDIATGDRSIDDKLISASRWTAACIDSIAKLPSKKVLILEEVDKLVNHILLGATCRRDRRAKLKAFEQKIKDADYVFCFDADMSGAAAQYLHSLDPDKATYGIHNIHSVTPWDCYIYTGEVNEKTGVEKPNNRKAFERDLLDAYSRGDNILVVSDSQRALEALERVLMTIDPERQVLRVDSFTKAENVQVDLFLKDPNLWISGGKPGAVLLSPTAEASLDITYKHFDSVWGMFVGAINHWGCGQMLARYRVPVDRNIFCRTHSLNDNHGSRSPIPAVVRKNIISTHFHTVREIALTDELVKDDDFELVKRLQSFLDPGSEEYQNPHFEALCNYIARDNYSRAHLREELIKSLSAAGHNVMIQDPESKVLEERISEATDDMLKEMAMAIAMAPDITIESARAILADMSTNKEDWYKAQKAIIKDQLPEYEFDAGFVYKRFLKDRRWIAKQEMRWMVAHPGVQEEIDRGRWRSALKNHHISWDIRSATLGVKVLQEIKILDLATSVPNWDMNSPIVHELKQKLLSIKERVKLGLGINVTSDSDPCALLRRLLDKIGIPVQGRQVRVKGSEKGERIRKYSINLGELTNPHYQAAEDALNIKHQKTLPKLSQVAVMVDISIIQPTCDNISAEELAKYIYPHFTLEEEEYAANAELLLIARNWEMIQALESGWTPAFSSHVWEMLTPVGRSHVARLAAACDAA